MNLTSYKYFVAVSQADSISQAAEVLMISPQALSEHMRRMEQELGVELFTHTRPARLTTCGERFLKYAEAMLYERYNLEKELRELSDKRREIVISVSASSFPPFISDVAALFSARYPDCLLTFVERSEPISPPALKAYDLNISSGSLSRGMTEVIIQGSDFTRKSTDELSSNSTVLLVRRKLLRRIWGGRYDENIARLEEKTRLELFRDIPFIRFVNNDNALYTDELFFASGFLPKVIAKAGSIEMCLSLCASGVGAIIMPDGWVARKLGPQTHSGELAQFRLEGEYPLFTTMVSYQRSKVLTEEERALIEMMQAYVSEL